MRKIGFVLLVAGGLASCTAAMPRDYNDIAQHPFDLTETESRLRLDEVPSWELRAVATSFAVARPNNGSSFIIAADPETAAVVEASLIRAGVAPRDIVTTAAGRVPDVTRIDRTVTVRDCYGPPTPIWQLTSAGDGYTHDNANSALLGCAIRRNIAMTADDPRDLIRSSPSAGRDGARAADVYNNWIHGQATESHQTLPVDQTTQSLGGAAQ
jgi:type IV pilus biogenesis protein CpaD/CtpE